MLKIKMVKLAKSWIKAQRYELKSVLCVYLLSFTELKLLNYC